MVTFMSISILLIFVVWMNYEIKKNNRLSNKGSKEFWEKESTANQKRPVDISGLDYLKIPYDSLPMQDTSDDTSNSYRDIILSLADKKILNLSDLSNTDLKLKYGVANLSILSEYDSNYIKLVSMLQKWGERLYSSGYVKEAQEVLEVAIDCSTDVRKTYELLTDIYISQGKPDKINILMDKISLNHVRDKESLLLKLEEQKQSL